MKKAIGKYLTLEDVAHIYGWSVQRLVVWVQTGVFPDHVMTRPGCRSTCFRTKELFYFLDACEDGDPSKGIKPEESDEEYWEWEDEIIEED
jgi:hypothetical protein